MICKLLNTWIVFYRGTVATDHIYRPLEFLDRILDHVYYASMGTSIVVSVCERGRQDSIRKTYAENITSPFPTTSIAAYRSSMMC